MWRKQINSLFLVALLIAGTSAAYCKEIGGSQSIEVGPHVAPLNLSLPRQSRITTDFATERRVTSLGASIARSAKDRCFAPDAQGPLKLRGVPSSSEQGHFDNPSAAAFVILSAIVIGGESAVGSCR